MFLGPNSFDPLLISGFVAAVIGGLDSPPGASWEESPSGSRSHTFRVRGVVAGPLAAFAILSRC